MITLAICHCLDAHYITLFSDSVESGHFMPVASDLRYTVNSAAD